MAMQSQSQRMARQLEYFLDGKASAQRLMVFDSVQGNNYMLHFQRSQLNNGVNEAASTQAPLLCQAGAVSEGRCGDTWGLHVTRTTLTHDATRARTGGGPITFSWASLGGPSTQLLFQP